MDFKKRRFQPISKAAKVPVKYKQARPSGRPASIGRRLRTAQDHNGSQTRPPTTHGGRSSTPTPRKGQDETSPRGDITELERSTVTATMDLGRIG